MTKLCPRGKSAAKRKFKVYPSAYANAYASKICAGKIKDPSGTKRKDFRGPKPAGKAVGGVIGKGVIKSANKLRKEGLPFKKLSATGILGATPVGMALKKYQDKQKNKKRDKAKVQKKMMGGVARTAGAQSALGRLQKARMMNKGGESEGNVSKSEMQVRSGREKAKKVIGKLKNFKNQSKGFLKEMAGFEKGGDAKIKKVISGLHKASALHKGQAKSLQSVVKKKEGGVMNENRDLRKTEQVTGKQENKFKDVRRKGAGERAVKKGILRKKNSYSSGGLARGGGAAIRGTKFQGVF